MRSKKEDKLPLNETFGITVDVRKLSRGLKTTFEGISEIFDSLGMEFDIPLAMESFTNKTSPQTVQNVQNNAMQSRTFSEESESAVPSTIEVIKENNAPETSENSETHKKIEQAQQQEKTKSAITSDNITKVIVEKLKQDSNNNKKIEELVHNYGVSVISQLPEEKYEAFMTVTLLRKSET